MDDKIDERHLKETLELKDAILSMLSKSQHPVKEVSQEISKNLKTIPEKIRVKNMYPVFSNYFDIYDKFDESVMEIEKPNFQFFEFWENDLNTIGNTKYPFLPCICNRPQNGPCNATAAGVFPGAFDIEDFQERRL